MHTMTVATYNIRQMTSLFRRNAVKPEHRERALAIADVLRRLDADLVGIVEAPTAAELQAFADEHLDSMAYQVASGQSRGYENLLFLYRDPLELESVDAAIDWYQPWTTDPYGEGVEQIFRWYRQPLEAVFRVDDTKLRAILVHGPHKGILRPVELDEYQMLLHAKRERAIAEAARLRMRLDQLLGDEPSIPIVVLGDMNDQPVLPASLRPATRGYVETLMGSVYARDLILVNPLWWQVADEAARQDLWTLEYPDPVVQAAFGRQHRVWIDHILVSPDMCGKDARVRMVPQAGGVAQKDSVSKLASDHYPVFCLIEVDE